VQMSEQPLNLFAVAMFAVAMFAVVMFAVAMFAVAVVGLLTYCCKYKDVSPVQRTPVSCSCLSPSEEPECRVSAESTKERCSIALFQNAWTRHCLQQKGTNSSYKLKCGSDLPGN
jgi:hypothetical protein